MSASSAWPGRTLHVVKRLGSGELENQVLDVVWGAPGPVTPRQVQDVLSTSRKLAYTTVMTILVRLCEKGLLEREPAGRSPTDHGSRVSSGLRRA